MTRKFCYDRPVNPGRPPNLGALGAAVPEILLPREGIDLEKWAVIACDQFTQDPAYWEEVRARVGDAPSTLDLIFPEVFLDSSVPGNVEEEEAVETAVNLAVETAEFAAAAAAEALENPASVEVAEAVAKLAQEALEAAQAAHATKLAVRQAQGARRVRIAGIHRRMADYLAGGVFAPPRRCCVYVERSTALHPLRRGLVMALDLAAYDRGLLRPTEEVIEARLPPRMEIRRRAPLETPHIIVLVDDPEDRLLGSLARRAASREPLYDTPLMLGGGAVRGIALDQEGDEAAIAEALAALVSRKGAEPFLYAVGDGNHSLAAARAVWEENRARQAGGASTTEEKAGERWALVEIENLYDPGIAFEPIHRAVFGAPPGAVLQALRGLPGYAETRLPQTGEAGRQRLRELVAEGGRLGVIAGREPECVLVETTAPGLLVAALQPLLKGFTLDYIHGGDALFHLVSSRDALGVLLPPFEKSSLFTTVASQGPLPRKSFSMGAAQEKRYYLECRRIAP